MTLLATRVILVAAALGAWLTWTGTSQAADLAVWLGSHPPAWRFGHETWLAQGAPSVPVGWLGDALFAWVSRAGGPSAVALAAGALFALALVVTEARARRRGGAFDGALAAVLAAACALGLARAGNGVATDAAFSAIVLAALDRRGRARFAAPVLVFVWSRLSAGALLGETFIVAVTIGAAIDLRIHGSTEKERLRELVVLSLLGAVALCAGPAALQTIAGDVAALGLDPGRQVVPIRPNDLAPEAYHGGFTLAILLGLIVAGRYGGRAGADARSSPETPDLAGASGCSDAAVLVTAFVLGFLNGRLLPVAGIALGPVLAGAAARCLGTPRLPAAASASVVAAGVAGLALATWQIRVSAPPRFAPTALVGAIARDASAHDLFCGQPLWCTEALGSHVRVGMDGRPGWPAEAVETQSTIALVKPHWDDLLRRHGVDRVVAYRMTALAGLLRLRRDWRTIGDDGRVTAFAAVTGVNGKRASAAR